MLIRLNRPDIIENIQTRFDARETGQRRPLELDDTIKVVLNIDDVLMYPTLFSDTLTPVGTGELVITTVPDGERWVLGLIRTARSGAGDATYDAYRISDGTNTMIVHGQTAAATYLWAPYRDVWLESGWQIIVNLAAWTTGNTQCWITCRVYEGY